MRIPEVLRVECIAVRASLPDKESALGEVARLAAGSAVLQGIEH